MGSEASAPLANEESDASWIGDAIQGDLTPLPPSAASGAEAKEPVENDFLTDLVEDEGRAHQVFRLLWARCAPANGVAPRMRVCEVLLQEARRLKPTAAWSSNASRTLARAFGGSLLPVGYEEAFRLARAVFRQLRQALSAEVADERAPLIALQRQRQEFLGRGVSRTDPVAPKVSPVSKQVAHEQELSRHLSQSPLDAVHRTTTKWATRAAQETETVEVVANFCNATGDYERLSLKCETLRCRLSQKPDSRAASFQLESLNGKLGVLRAKAKSLADRYHFTSSTYETYASRTVALQKELASASREWDSWPEQAKAAKERCEQNRRDVDFMEQEAEDLQRRYQAEQLRALMLQSAVEAERVQLGASLDTAETHFAGLEEALLDAEQFELQEQAVERELVSEANEILVARMQDEAAAEARIAVLRSELGEVDAQSRRMVLEVADAERGAAAAGTAHRGLAGPESSARAAAAELSAARRRSRDAAAAAQRHAAEASVLSKSNGALEARIRQMPELLGRAKAVPLQHEVASAQAVLQQKENLLKARQGELQACERTREAAAQREAQFLEAFGQARAELQEDGGWLTWFMGGESEQNDSLAGTEEEEAALLQRRLGEVLAEAAAKECEFEEARVHISAGSPRGPVPLGLAALAGRGGRLSALSPRSAQRSPEAFLEGTLARLEAELARHAAGTEQRLPNGIASAAPPALGSGSLETSRLKMRIKALESKLDQKEEDIHKRSRTTAATLAQSRPAVDFQQRSLPGRSIGRSPSPGLHRPLSAVGRALSPPAAGIFGTGRVVAPGRALSPGGGGVRL